MQRDKITMEEFNSILPPFCRELVRLIETWMRKFTAKLVFYCLMIEKRKYLSFTTQFKETSLNQSKFVVATTNLLLVIANDYLLKCTFSYFEHVFKFRLIILKY